MSRKAIKCVFEHLSVFAPEVTLQARRKDTLLIICFPLVLFPPPVCHLVSTPSYLCRDFTAPCCNFNISIFHLIFPEQKSSVAELFSSDRKSGWRKVWHINTHQSPLTHKITNTFTLWIYESGGGFFFAREKFKMVILELWPGKERGRSIRRTDPPPAIITIHSPVLLLMDDHSLNPPSSSHPCTHEYCTHTHSSL